MQRHWGRAVWGKAELQHVSQCGWSEESKRESKEMDSEAALTNHKEPWRPYRGLGLLL